MIYSKKH